MANMVVMQTVTPPMNIPSRRCDLLTLLYVAADRTYPERAAPAHAQTAPHGAIRSAAAQLRSRIHAPFAPDQRGRHRHE